GHAVLWFLAIHAANRPRTVAKVALCGAIAGPRPGDALLGVGARTEDVIEDCHRILDPERLSQVDLDVAAVAAGHRHLERDEPGAQLLVGLVAIVARLRLRRACLGELDDLGAAGRLRLAGWRLLPRRRLRSLRL